MKLLLYCTKAKPYLVDERKMRYHNFVLGDSSVLKSNEKDLVLNGKIVAECDFEVEEIGQHRQFLGCGYDLFFETDTLEDLELQEKACLDTQQLNSYFMSNADNGEKVGYAIHIKNLHIFDKPRELSDYKRKDEFRGGKQVFWGTITKAPQNMMYAYDNEGNKYIVISIQPQWVHLILNHIKDIEVRKVILKEMLKNE